MAKITGKPGNYAIRFWYNNIQGEQKSKYKSGFKTKAEANAWADKAEKELSGLNPELPTDISALVDAVIKEKEIQGIAYNTMRKYKMYFKVIKEHFGKTEIGNIRKQHIIDFLQENANNDVGEPAPAKAEILKKLLSMIYKYAVGEEITIYNPMPYIKLPNRTVKYTIYSIEQARELLNALKEANSYLYPVAVLALFFGLRRGEICALRKSAIRNNTIYIYMSAYHNRNSGQIEEREAKTKSGIRQLPVPATILPELAWYQSHNNIDSKFVVCKPDGTQLNPDVLTTLFPKFLKKHNLKKIKLHELRHTFAEISLKSGTDLDTLKRLMGHASIDITSDIYLHEDTDRLQKQIKKTAEVLLR